MTLPSPKWLDKVPTKDRGAEYRRFLLRVAALYASREGHMTTLSEALGLQATSLSTFASPRGEKTISPRIAHGVEKLTQGLVPAAELNESLPTG
jgi:hypothetical protein